MQVNMAHFPKEMKPVGYTVKEQQGDWLIIWEVVGWNNRTQTNIWAEKKRTYNPRPQLSQIVASIDAEIQHQYTRNLHRMILG